MIDAQGDADGRRVGLSERIRIATPTIVALGLLFFAVRWFAIRWQAVGVSRADLNVSPLWLSVSVSLFAINAWTTIQAWRHILRGVGANVSRQQAMDLFVPSILPRYIPGRVWAHAVRVALGRRLGIQITRTSGALAWEGAVAVTIAGVIAALTLPFRADANYWWPALLLTVAAGVFWLVGFVFTTRPRVKAVLERWGGTKFFSQPSILVKPLLWYIAGWVAFGLAHVAIVHSLIPNALENLSLIIGSVALAWALGFVAIVVPLGLGVRDAALLVLLSPILTNADALAFVAIARAMQLLTDILISVGWLLGRGRAGFARHG